MKRKVEKRGLVPPDENGFASVSFPKGAQLLAVGMNEGNLVAWALVNPDVEEMEERRLLIVETAKAFDIPDEVGQWRYLGTLAGPGLHVFKPGGSR